MEKLDPVTHLEVKEEKDLGIKAPKRNNNQVPSDPPDPPETPIVESSEEDSSPKVDDMGVPIPDQPFQEMGIGGSTVDLPYELREYDSFVGISDGGTHYLREENIDQNLKIIANNQSSLNQLGRASLGFTTDLVGTFVSNLGYIFDFHNHINLGESPGNWLSDSVEGLQEDLKEDLKIYRTSDESVAFGEFGWWAEGFSDLGTTAGMFADTLLFRGLGAAAKSASLFSKLNTVNKYTKGAMSSKDIWKASKSLNRQNKIGLGEDLVYAAISRAGESSMEANGTYKEVKEQLLSEGILENEAERLARDAAQEVYKYNWAMIGQDLFTQRMYSGFLGKSNFLGKWSKKVKEIPGAKGKALKYAFGTYGITQDMVSEGLEEAYQYIVQEDATNKALVSAGLRTGPDYKSMYEYWRDPEMWNSAFWGAMGSGLMGQSAKGIGYIKKKKAALNNNMSISEYDKLVEKRELDLKEKKLRSIQRRHSNVQDLYQKISDAVIKEDYSTVDKLLKGSAVHSAITDVLTGQEDGAEVSLEAFGNDPVAALSKMQGENLEVTEEQKKIIENNIKSYKESYNKTKKIFEKNLKKHGDNIGLAEYFTIHESNYERAKQDYREVKEKVNEKNTSFLNSLASTDGLTKNVAESTAHKEAVEDYIKQLEIVKEFEAESIRNSLGFPLTEKGIQAQINKNAEKIDKEIKYAKQEAEKISKELEELLESIGPEKKADIDTELGDLKNTEAEEYKKALVEERFTKKLMANAKERFKDATAKQYQKIVEEINKQEEEVENNEKKSTGETPEGKKTNTKNPEKGKDPNTGEDYSDDNNSDTKNNEKNDKDSSDFNEDANEKVTDNFLNKKQKDYEENTKLTKVNGAAWISAYNRDFNEEGSSAEEIANAKKLAEILEDPTTNLDNYEVEYSVDMEYLELQHRQGGGQSFYSNQLEALNKGEEVPLVGLLPVKMTLIDKSTGQPVLTDIDTETKLYIHDSHDVEEIVKYTKENTGIPIDTNGAYTRNYNFHNSIQEEAKNKITQVKKEIAENYNNPIKFKGSLEKTNNGHVIYNSEPLLANELNNVNTNAEFYIGSSTGIVNAEGVTSTRFINSPTIGGIYIKDTKGNVFPAKTRFVTQEESEVLLDAYLEYFDEQAKAGKDLPDLVASKELRNKLKEAGNFGYLGSNPKVFDIIKTLVNQGNSTKGKGVKEIRSYKDKKGNFRLKIDGVEYSQKQIQDKKSELASIISKNKLRNIQREKLNDKAYKAHILGFLTTHFNSTPNGDMLVQPTIVHNFKKQESTESSESTEETISVEEDTGETIDTEKELASLQVRLKGLEALSNINESLAEKNKPAIEEIKNRIQKLTSESTLDTFDVGSELSNTAKNKLNKLGFTDSIIKEMSKEDIELAKTFTSIEDAKSLLNKYRIKEVESKSTEAKKAEDFNTKLANKIQSKLQELYPEIKLNITNNPVWEQGDNVFNQEDFNNQVNYRLKAVDILTSPKADQVFNKGLKNKWTLDKMLSELQVPKQQKTLINNVLESMSYFEGIPFNHQIALELASSYSYGVEINTAGIARQDYFDTSEGSYISKGEGMPTRYYANLTVPGGINYAENEITTPLITPSIKGHAKFSTNQGIGWFRADDKGVNTSTNEEAGLMDENGNIIPGLEATKTRRILELQSDLFQKGRGESSLKNTKIKIREDKPELGIIVNEVVNTDGTVSVVYENGFKENIPGRLIKEENIDSKENQFLQLLNKSNNWVTFFVKSIIQDSAKQGYEKVLFPKGDTAARIEGHQTLESFRKEKEKRIELLNKSLKKQKNLIGKEYNIPVEDFMDEGELGTDVYTQEQYNTYEKNIINEINQLKKELVDVESGKTQLSSIANFYENTIFNILKKQFGKENVVEIADEFGNTWNELTINQARDLANVLLQRNEANQIIGQANIKAMTVLIDAVNQKQDTLPHEYAHHYIAWNRDTPIVQEAIKKWGSEEALVQAIGEQVVKQKGEAYTWWQKFVNWLLGDMSKISKLDREKIKNILTDAFLTRQDLNIESSAVPKIDVETLKSRYDKGEMMFDFTESEWNALTEAYPDIAETKTPEIKEENKAIELDSESIKETEEVKNEPDQIADVEIESDVKPKIRGKQKLPSLKKKGSIKFSKDKGAPRAGNTEKNINFDKDSNLNNEEAKKNCRKK